MAKIPSSIASRSLDPGNVIQMPTGSPIAKAIEGFGGQMTDVASRALERQQQAERFDATVGMDSLKAELQGDLERLDHETPNATGLTKTFSADYLDKKGKAYIGSLPPSVRPEFEKRWQVEQLRLQNVAARTEMAGRERYETGQIRTRVAQASNTLAANPNALPQITAEIDGVIDSGAMSATGKEALRQVARERLATSSAEGLAINNPALARRQLGFGTPVEQAMQLIASKEGFQSGTYFDVSAHRVGFGSDTITNPDGSFRAVRQGDTVDEAGAMRDLRRRTGIYMDQNKAEIGEEAYGRLTTNQQSAIASVRYNYGRLPDAVLAAAKTGDANALASSIEGLQDHNGGVNRNRRLAEAEYSRTGSAVAPQYASIPFEKRMEIVRRANVVDAQAKFEIRQAATDDLASIEKTGQGGKVTPEQVMQLGTDQYRQWVEKRTTAKGIWDATNDMPQISDQAISDRVNALLPRAGDPGFAQKQAVYDAALKRSQEIEKMRRDDPAASVAEIPEVREVISKVRQNDPQSTQAGVTAVLAAQSAAGIPNALQSPITRNEAQRLAAPLVVASRTTGRDTVTPQERAVLQGVVKTVSDIYGPYAERVLPRVIEEGLKDRQFGPMATAIFKKMAAGQPITSTDRANVEAASDAGNATGAMAGSSASSVKPTPSYNAIQMLLTKPELAPQFDQKYGAGYSARLLQARP